MHACILMHAYTHTHTYACLHIPWDEGIFLKVLLLKRTIVRMACFTWFEEHFIQFNNENLLEN